MVRKKKYQTDEEREQARKESLKRAYHKYYDRVKKEPEIYAVTYARNNKKRYEKVMSDPILKKQRDDDIKKWQQRNPEKLREYRKRYYENTKLIKDKDIK